MSLYFDAANVLSADASAGGSFKSRVYNNSNLKSSPAQVYALIAETSKWDTVLKEVVDNAGILATEPKVCFAFTYLVLAPRASGLLDSVYRYE